LTQKLDHKVDIRIVFETSIKLYYVRMIARRQNVLLIKSVLLLIVLYEMFFVQYFDGVELFIFHITSQKNSTKTAFAKRCDQREIAHF
jgi:hypothetical protein